MKSQIISLLCSKLPMDSSVRIFKSSHPDRPGLMQFATPAYLSDLISDHPPHCLPSNHSGLLPAPEHTGCTLAGALALLFPLPCFSLNVHGYLLTARPALPTPLLYFIHGTYQHLTHYRCYFLINCFLPLEWKSMILSPLMLIAISPVTRTVPAIH